MRHLTALLTTVSILAPVACWAQSAPPPSVDRIHQAWSSAGFKPIQPSDLHRPVRGDVPESDDDTGTSVAGAPAAAAVRPAAPPRSPAPAAVASTKAPEAPVGNSAGAAPAPASKQVATAAPPGSDSQDQCSDVTGACSFYVPFTSGSAELTAAVKAKLETLGKALQGPTWASIRVRIEGHTDTVGSRDFNQALSLQRAKAVADYLEAQYGVDASRLVPVGKGKDSLPHQTADQTPDQKNRVVLIVPVGA